MEYSPFVRATWTLSSHFIYCAEPVSRTGLRYQTNVPYQSSTSSEVEYTRHCGRLFHQRKYVIVDWVGCTEVETIGCLQHDSHNLRCSQLVIPGFGHCAVQCCTILQEPQHQLVCASHAAVYRLLQSFLLIIRRGSPSSAILHVRT